jgi:hypothetical protein
MVDLQPSPLPDPAATGTLAQKPLAHLVIYSLERRLTGTLELHDPRGERASVVLHEGMIHKVDTSEHVAYLGRVLFELGYVDEETLGRSLTDLASTRRLHGLLLRERGAVTDGQLQEGLRELRLRKLHHAFTMPAATSFAYYNKVDVVGDRPGDVEPMDPFAATWRGVRENPPLAQVRAALARVDGHALRLNAATALERFGFVESERCAAECLRLKALTIPDLVAAGFLPPPLTELLAYMLLITKHVDIVARPGVTPPPPQPSSIPPHVAAFGSGQYAMQVSFSLRAAPYSAETTPRPSQAPGSHAPHAHVRHTPVPTYATTETPHAFAPSSSSPEPPHAGPRSSMPPASHEPHDAHAARSARHPSRPSQLAPGEASVAGSSPAPPAASVQKLPRHSAAGNAFFAQAEMNLALKDYGEAEALVRKALLAAPGRAEYVALLAWCEANDPGKTSAEHTRAQVFALDRALMIDPAARRAHYYRAELNKRLGEKDSAIADYRLALQVDPDDVEAQRELKLLEIKTGARSVPPGGAARHNSGLFEKPKRK